jgi:hypothetical protein
MATPNLERWFKPVFWITLALNILAALLPVIYVTFFR